jgi:GMP synthase-like glutamine amidotransferase
MRVLVLQHLACEHPGSFSQVIDERGVEAVPVEIDEGEALPDWREFDSVLAMGGPMGAYEEEAHPWLAPEKELLREAADAGKPILGVCLGVQLLASALGAEVTPMDKAEVGMLPVELTEAGRADPLFDGVPEPLITLQWHGDTFELPDGAALLASSPAAPNQAFRAGEAAYGIQFHVEVTPEMVDEWAEVPAYRESLAATLGEERGDEFLAEAKDRAEEVRPGASRLFSNWLDLSGA